MRLWSSAENSHMANFTRFASLLMFSISSFCNVRQDAKNELNTKKFSQLNKTQLGAHRIRAVFSAEKYTINLLVPRRGLSVDRALTDLGVEQ
jgi:hypothetical protein